MSPYLPLLYLWLLSAAMMVLGWLWQYRTRDATHVDALWALGLGVAAVGLAALGDGAIWPRIALALGGGIWSLRLATSLGARARNVPEDGRYRAMRQRWDPSEQFPFFVFFQVQALVVVLFALPFVAVARNPETHPVWLGVGAIIWLASVAGEALADRQLARFRADPSHQGRTCRQGLWRYSRHPNYFFEWLHWFAYLAFAVGSPIWWLALVGPVVMYLFLRYVSGVPWTEQQALRSRGDDYRDYQRATSVMIPWPPKNSAKPSKQKDTP